MFAEGDELIRRINEGDLAEIAGIHKLAFDESHFTYHLPEKSLVKFYKKLIQLNSFNFLFEDTDQKKIGGFIIAGEKTQKSIDLFLKENIAEVLKLFIRKPKLIIPKLKAVKAKVLNKKTFSSDTTLRLLSIAVSPEYQNKKIGRQLIEFLEMELIKNNIRQYGLSVKNDNKKAIAFYKKNGYLIESEIDGGIYYFKKL